MAGLSFALVIMGAGLQEVRFGGPIQRENQEYSDVIADILPPPLYVVEPYLEANRLLADPASLAARRQRLGVLEQQFREREAFWHSSELPPEVRGAPLDAVAATGNAFWNELDGTLTAAIARGDMAGAQASGRRLEDIYEQHRVAVDTFVAAAQRAQGELAQRSVQTLWLIVGLMAAVGLAMIGLVAWLLRFVDRTVMAPVEAIAGSMEAMSRGSLDVEVAGLGRGDEIGVMAEATQSFRTAYAERVRHEAQQREVVDQMARAMDELARGNLMHRITAVFAGEYAALRTSYNGALDALSGALRRAGDTAETVNGGAREIRAASDDLAMRTEQQAARLESAATALTEVTGSIGETARDAADAAGAVGAACEASREGGEVVRRAIAAMDEIDRSAREISSIIEVIDGIAFQTNLLALNAGVEAGKGFAVVANEVRALSGRSSEAASEIRRLIADSTRHVGSGVSLVGETGTVLEGIAGRVGEVASRLGAITVATSEQADKVREISGVVSEMDRSTQQNAAMVEQTTAAARSLSGEAETLRSLIATFRTGDGPAALRRAA